jgi:hypothetical protein
MEGQIIEITKINEKDRVILESAGFIKKEKNTWLVPSDLTIITKRPRYDLIDIDIFYGDTKIINVWGKTAFYDYHIGIHIINENMQKYMEKSISPNRGENVEQSIKDSMEASRKEQERQINLSKTNPKEYEHEGMISLFGLLVKQ